MCQAAMSQKRIERGCSVVASRKKRRTRPHSVRSQATCAWMKSDVRDERTKTAQGGEKTELADLFSQVEPEPGLMEIGAPMLLGESGSRSADASRRRRAEAAKTMAAADHSSFP